MRLPNLLPLLLMILFCGCAGKASREDELAYLRPIMSPELQAMAHVEVASIKNIVIAGEGKDSHLGLGILAGQEKVHGGIRAEVSVDYPYKMGDTVRYSWRFKIPSDFISDAPKNRWCLIGQWHDQPNKPLGESWDRHPSLSPPVLLGLGELEGKTAVVLNYGPTSGKAKQRIVGPVFIEKGKWHSIAFVIHWSGKPDGSVSVYLDDMTKPVMTADGPNMNNEYQHYLKLGMYRHPEIATENWIFIDDLEISKLATH